MKLKPNDLLLYGYKLDKDLSHDDVIPFVRSNIRKTNPFSVFYLIFNVIVIISFLYLLFNEQRLPIFECFMQAFLGVLFFFIILLPLHEAIHGLSYILLGAQKVSFTAQWRKLVFYAVADSFVANMQEFLIVALTPFLLINSALIVVMCFVPATWFWTLFGALILHTGGCFGDYGMVSYFYHHRKHQPCTYDDSEGKKTLFYLRTLRS